VSVTTGRSAPTVRAAGTAGRGVSIARTLNADSIGGGGGGGTAAASASNRAARGIRGVVIAGVPGAAPAPATAPSSKMAKVEADRSVGGGGMGGGAAGLVAAAGASSTPPSMESRGGAR
jgi:hypothetical protein